MRADCGKLQQTSRGGAWKIKRSPTHTHMYTRTHTVVVRVYNAFCGVKWVMVEDDKEEEGLGVSLSVRCLRLKLYNFWPGQTNHKYTHWFARTLKKKRTRRKSGKQQNWATPWKNASHRCWVAGSAGAAVPATSPAVANAPGHQVRRPHPAICCG